MAYFKFKFDNTNTSTNGSHFQYWMRCIQNAMAGLHTSASTIGTLTGENVDAGIAAGWVNADSIIINDAAHRTTKHAGDLWSNTTSTSSADAVYHLASNAYGTSDHCNIQFYKRHYMSNLIDGASTTTTFNPYVKMRLNYRTSTGWSMNVMDKNGSNAMPNSGGDGVNAYPTYNTSNHEIGDSNWSKGDTLEIWMGETFFVVSAYHWFGQTPSNAYKNDARNFWFGWFDFPYIDKVDGYGFGEYSTYYPGVMVSGGMANHDVRIKNSPPDTSDKAEWQIRRFGAVNGLGTYYNTPSYSHNYFAANNLQGYTYAPYPSMWPGALTPVTPLPSADGLGPLMIPCQYQGSTQNGRGSSTSTIGSSGGAASTKNWGDSRWSPMLGLYRLNDEFGNAPGDRLKVGGDYYRTIWSHKFGGSYESFNHGSSYETAVFAVPEKSVVGPDPI